MALIFSLPYSSEVMPSFRNLLSNSAGVIRALSASTSALTSKLGLILTAVAYISANASVTKVLIALSLNMPI